MKAAPFVADSRYRCARSGVTGFSTDAARARAPMARPFHEVTIYD